MDAANGRQKNRLSDPQMFQLYRWLDVHATDLGSREFSTRTALVAYVSGEIGFQVPIRSLLKAARLANVRVTYSRSRTGPRKGKTSRLQAKFNLLLEYAAKFWLTDEQVKAIRLAGEPFDPLGSL